MNNVVKLRKLYKLTQSEVSVLINYPKPLYVAFEHEKIMLPDEIIERIASVFHVSVDYLLKDMSI